MILTVNYEEMLALRVGARTVLDHGPGGGVAVAAPPEDRARVSALPPLDGDLSVGTLVELGPLEAGVEAIVNALRIAMDEQIVATHPASETAVASYFDYAHALSVLDRIQDMRGEMESVIEVVTGAPPDDHVAGTFVFPD